MNPYRLCLSRLTGAYYRNPKAVQPGDGSLGENTTNNPQFLRKESKLNFEWKVRNLPYPPETY